MTHRKIYRMATFTWIFFFMLIFIDTYSCTVTKKSVYICCEDIYANGIYKYSADTNWTTNKLHSEEWDSEIKRLASIDHAPFSRNWNAEVKQVFSGNIDLKTCLNLTYRATDDKYKEMHVQYIVIGCSKEEQYSTSEVTSKLYYLIGVVSIIGVMFILGIEWKIGCLRRRFSRRRNGQRQPVDDQNMAEEDKETFC